MKMQVTLSLHFLILLLSWDTARRHGTEAFAPATLSLIRQTNTLVSKRRFAAASLASTYGRGADIWPPTNEEPVRLKDSFPQSTIPEPAVKVIQQIGSVSDEKKPLRWRRFFPRAIDRILRRAASAQEEEAFQSMDGGKTDLTPAVVAAMLLFYLRPLDILLVSFVTGYLSLLAVVARTVRKDGVTPTLPALPPQGHVPTLVSNPLGYQMTYSIQYDRWLKLAVGLGLIGPLLFLIRYTLDSHMAAARLVARPVFFLCVQILTESVTRRLVTPLPLRILVPVAYNTIRLGYLWQWFFYPEPLGVAGRILALSNLVFWAVNLFGFLLPVAVMRYMRAHFVCVELEQVHTRPGMEESLGLSSSSLP